MTFDACAPLSLHVIGATAEQETAIAAGAALWHDHGAPLVGEAGADRTIDVQLQNAAGNSFGLYDPVRAVIYLNVGLSGRALSIVTAHELGHSFGLVHVTDRVSLMNPANTETPPTDDDRRAVEALWGTCTP